MFLMPITLENNSSSSGLTLSLSFVKDGLCWSRPLILPSFPKESDKWPSRVGNQDHKVDCDYLPAGS